VLQHIKALLLEEGISLVAPLSLDACSITKPYLLERAGITCGTAFLFAVPYYTTECDDPARNISAYAVAGDYHRYFELLFARVLPALREKFPENRFAGFTDHSPIAEGEAAVRAGLGYFGYNHLFLTDAHSSFVFLGEILTDAVLDAPGVPVRSCTQCGACARACPVGLDVSRCHSALTQKKGALTEEERQLIKAGGLCWGCDRCQEACPHNRQAEIAPHPCFAEYAPWLAEEDVSAANLREKPYGWRGPEVLKRNLEILAQE
jgi:epoxyqueuosine reductase